MKVRAVLFDLDGVLLDSIDAWFKTFNDVLGHYGRPRISREKFVRDIFGGPIEEDIKNYFGSSSEGELKGLYCKFFPKNASVLKPFEGAVELLAYLRGKGVKTALVTNTPRTIALQSLESSGLSGLLDVVKTPDDVSAGKPNPEMLYAALDELRVDKGEAVMVGDTKTDLASARAAGVYMIGVGVEGDVAIRDIRELKSIV